ncbi:MAG: hypothetical protein OXH36_04575 [Bdellovibrionales bacterium]|nr:hypothetical protein [Bdellovibrionales bacterium]
MSLKPSNFQIPPPENEELFERLCLDLYKLKFGDQAKRNGRRGQSQDGVDIFVQDQHIGIQCKKKDFNDKVKGSELKAEIQKAKDFKPPLKRYILATTCKRDAKIQEIARSISEDHKNQNLFSVEIHSWYEIKELLDEYSEVYEKYYFRPSSQQSASITPAIIRANQSESHHQELNRIRDLINEDKPKTALKLLEIFKKEKWNQLENKEKYKVLTNMAWAKIGMRQEVQASELLIEALQFNKEDENANGNCALAYLIIGDIENTKKYIEKTKELNPLNITACILEIQIKDRENQPLKDIVSSIPQNMKTKHQVAHILCHISIKRKQYREAEKWLKSFCNAQEQDKVWKDVNDEADYADMSLGLILAKQDIFSGRHISDNLKDKLEEIIEIYKKLITDNQYSELKDFNPNWYLHYALALELNGKLNDAIYILQEGIRKFSYDDHLKIELSRLFGQKGDIAQSISILEKLLGLQFLNSDDSLDSISKNSFTLNKIDISEKSFSLALILTDLYFKDKQQEKARELLHQITESPSINEDDRLELKQYSIFRMINFGEIDEAEEMLKPLFAEDNDNIFNLILKSKVEEAKEALSGTVQDSTIHKDKKIQYLKKAYNIFKDKKYNNEADQDSFYFKKKERLRDIEQLSQELYFSKMYKEAEPLLEEITNKNLNHPGVFNLLYTYFENGKNRLAIELAEALLKKFPNKIQPANVLFIIYESLGNKQKAIQYYEDFFKSNPKNDLIRIELAYKYTYSEHISKAKELLKRDFNLNQLSSEQMIKLSLAYMKTGSIKKALETQYKCIKKNPGKMEPQSVYFELITFLDHPGISDMINYEKESKTPKLKEYESNNKLFLHPDKVGLDCYVRIKDIESAKETGIIIEEDSDYPPDHEFSQMLLGKKPGDEIVFCNKKYQIMEIKSKYLHKYHEIGEEAEKKFGSKSFLKAFYIKETDSKQIFHGLKQTIPSILKQEKNLSRIFQFYKERKATIGSIAKITGKHPIEITEELISPYQDNKFISAIPVWENDKKIQKLLDKKTNIVVDLLSLVMIYQLKIEKYVEESKFKTFICQSTLDSLKEYIQKMALDSKDGRLTVGFDKEGNPVKNFIRPEMIKQHLNFWIEAKIWAENNCQIKPISTDIILSREERWEREKLLGKEFLDPLLATDKSFILLCEDAILRKYAEQEFFISGVRLFNLIEYFERQVIIDNDQAVKFKAKLVQLNQTYIPIDHNILLFFLKEAEYSVNNIGFQRGLFFLGPISRLPGVINVVANFLIELCQKPSLLPYNKQIITKELLDKSSFGRDESPKQIAYQVVQLVQLRTKLLPILQNEICEYIIVWLKNKIY